MLEVLPSNLESKISYMQNYSKTQIRMTPSTGSAPVKAGDTTVFKLPSAKVVDLATLRFNFHAKTNGAVDEVVGFPRFISSLISQFEIWCNGISVMNIQRYNHTYNIVKNYSTDYEKIQKKLLNNADPSTDFTMSATGVITKYNTYSDAGTLLVNSFEKDYCIDDFIGFFDFSDGNRQSFFNTNLVGDFEIHLTWATDKVLWGKSGGAITAPTYTITNLIGWIDAIDFKDEKYISAIDAKISTPNADGTYNAHLIPFKNYRSYTGSATTNSKECTIRVVENTNCLDKLIFTYLDPNMNTISTLQLGDQTHIKGTSADEATLLVNQNELNTDVRKVPQSLFNYEYLKSVKNPYLLNTSRYFRYSGVGLGYDATRTKSALIQFELDSQDLHNPMDINSVYQETLKAFELNYNNIHKTNVGIQHMETYLRDFFVSAYSLSHIGDDKKGVLLSGIATNSTAVNVAVKVTNQQVATDNSQAGIPLLITEMTSVLKIGNGRTIAVQP